MGLEKEYDIASVCLARDDYNKCRSCIYYGIKCEGVSNKYKVNHPADAFYTIQYKFNLIRNGKKTEEN